jgi:hypothetical protein
MSAEQVSMAGGEPASPVTGRHLRRAFRAKRGPEQGSIQSWRLVRMASTILDVSMKSSASSGPAKG